MIRLPDFVDRNNFAWAIETATQKKKIDFSKAEFFTYQEGMCVQSMHIGSYDTEPETIEQMELFIKEQGYQTYISDKRFHHEIYLSDPRRTSDLKLRTVIRHPICRI